MRELRFRIWDNGEMFYETGEAYAIRFDGVVGRFNETTDHYNTIADPKIMQWTGLRDRYNTRIYEGDIVKTARRVGRGYREQYPCAVRYSEITARWYPLDIVITERCEVIGDIYRTPELLKP